ncbi:MAG: hypothetical protein IT328_23615 [Caldilineaceae bacterium]|nr:hypothetical protein [Caldilineaceae bacterium]
MLGPIKPHTRFTRNVVVAILLFLAAGSFATGLLIPVQAAPPAQEQDAAPPPGSMMGNNMMGQDMMGSGMSMVQMGAMMAHMHGMMGTMAVTGTMSMGTLPMMEMMPMCAMMPMDGSMPMMGTMSMPSMIPMTDTMPMMGMMPMSGTMPVMGMMAMTDTMHMAYAGMMMQAMGMMQMHMGCMQMMMGAMMSGNMMDEGMGTQNVVPETTPAAPAGHPAPSLASTPQAATAGAVTVEAVPLASEELLEIAFAITLETHSVELNFDLAELATLTIGEASFPATGWTPDAPSGHHVAGTLRFTIDHPAHAELAEVDEVTLELRDIDGQQVTLRFAVSEQ